MVTAQPGVVVLVRFPFSDLSSSKLRPAVVLAVPLNSQSFASGGLGRESVARPGKLFTASQSLFVKPVGNLTAAAHRELVSRVVGVLQLGVR